MVCVMLCFSVVRINDSRHTYIPMHSECCVWDSSGSWSAHMAIRCTAPDSARTAVGIPHTWPLSSKPQKISWDWYEPVEFLEIVYDNVVHLRIILDVVQVIVFVNDLQDYYIYVDFQLVCQSIGITLSQYHLFRVLELLGFIRVY